MNYAVILSGGIGTRMRSDGFPKQYLEVRGKPILLYALESFEACDLVDKIVIVANEQWTDQISNWAKQYGITKLAAFAEPGRTRQHSLLNGLLACAEFGVTEQDIVLIHDAVRPLVTPELIRSCAENLEGHDAVLPVVPMKDAIYFSEDGLNICAAVDRSKLFCGQSPETFWLRQYLELNQSTPDEELALIRGSSELAFKNGLDVHMITGEETNFKLTTPDDMLRLHFYIDHANNA